MIYNKLQSKYHLSASTCAIGTSDMCDA